MSLDTAVRDPSVLLAFRARNVRSFRDQFELSLVATRLAEPDVARPVEWRADGRPIDVLPVAAVFGANGSGKSNVLKAMDDMRHLVLTSFRSGSPTGGIPRRPFLLDAESASVSSEFDLDLVLAGVRHTYRFEIDDEQVVTEEAHRYPRGRAALLFSREGLQVELGPSAGHRGRAVTELLRPNALFLSTAAATNHPSLLPLYDWFGRNLHLAEADSRPFRQALTAEMLGDERWRDQVLALLRAADLGVVDAVRKQVDPAMKHRLQQIVRILQGGDADPDSSDDGPSFDELGVRLRHQGAAGIVELEPNDESLGTRVWFGVIGPVVQALADGSVFLADELDTSLHQALVSRLIRLFQDRATNPHRAQLILNSHDSTLLGDTRDRVLGRDQIWFTEKTQDGSTRLYPLSDLDPRKEEAIGRRYLAGRYGATPILSDQEFGTAAELITAAPPR